MEAGSQVAARADLSPSPAPLVGLERPCLETCSTAPLLWHAQWGRPVLGQKKDRRGPDMRGLLIFGEDDDDFGYTVVLQEEVNIPSRDAKS